MAEINMILLGKVLAMTASDHDGEALAAIRRANVMLKTSGMTWLDVLAAPCRQADPIGSAGASTWGPMRRPGEVRLGREHMVRARMLLASGFPWDEWKANFLRSMANRDAELTPGQRAKLQECKALVADWRKAA